MFVIINNNNNNNNGNNSYEPHYLIRARVRFYVSLAQQP